MRERAEIKKLKCMKWLNINKTGMRGIIHNTQFIGTVVISTDAGWDHVSFSLLDGSMPTWEQMCFIKDLFFKEDEAVIEIHPPKSDYVNMVNNCLHLWRCTYKEMLMPPSILVGTNKNLTQEEYFNQIKEAYELAGEVCPITLRDLDYEYESLRSFQKNK